MSNDLISRKAAIALIDELGYINVRNHEDFEVNCRVDKIRQSIVELPTAFDKEKVIEQMERAEDYCNDYSSEICDKYDSCFTHAIDIAINIVEKGGL